MYVQADMDVNQEGVNLELPPTPQLELTEEEGGGEERREEGMEEAEVSEVKLSLKIK